MRPLVTRQDAMDALNVGRTKLGELMRQGEIPYVRVGRKVLFRPEDLERWVESRLSFQPE